MFKRHRAAEFILRGIRIDSSSWFANRGFYGHIDISDKPAFMLSDGFIRNQKQFTCDKDQFENGSILKSHLIQQMILILSIFSIFNPEQEYGLW